MVNYYDLNELLKQVLSDEFFLQIINKILEVTLPVKGAYPEYKNWFLNKHIPGIGKNRNILFAVYQEKIVGVINLKKSDEEKKICTLYVRKGFRFNRIGTTLLKMAFDYLGTDKPLITISDDKLFDLKRFIVKHKWEISERLDNFYTYNHNEYIFNGSLYVPNQEDEVFKIYRKDKNNIIRISILHWYYKIQKRKQLKYN